jgi:hypothetical protein
MNASEIAEKVRNGEQITRSEGEYLVQEAGLLDSLNYNGLMDKMSTGESLSHSDISQAMSTSSPVNDFDGFGNLAGFGAGLAMGGVPGSKTVQGAVTSGWKGAEEGLRREAFGLLGLPGSVANVAIDAATSPNPTKSVAKTLGSFVGGITAGPFGSAFGATLASMAYDSFTEGWIGDQLGTRSYESIRDTYEDDLGYSRKESSAAAESIGKAEKADADALSRAAGYGAADKSTGYTEPSYTSIGGSTVGRTDDQSGSASISNPGNMGDKEDGNTATASPASISNPGNLGDMAADTMGGGGGNDSDDGGGWSDSAGGWGGDGGGMDW